MTNNLYFLFYFYFVVDTIRKRLSNGELKSSASLSGSYNDCRCRPQVTNDCNTGNDIEQVFRAHHNETIAVANSTVPLLMDCAVGTKKLENLLVEYLDDENYKNRLGLLDNVGIKVSCEVYGSDWYKGDFSN